MDYKLDTTDLSDEMLKKTVKEILSKVTINDSYDIPYLAGYSNDGKTIYIDRKYPRYMQYKTKKIDLFPLIALHEKIEKTLQDELGLEYKFAHQIALRSEFAFALALGIPEEVYNEFNDYWIKQIGGAAFIKVPSDLDLKPYIDSNEPLLGQIKAVMKEN